SVVHGRLDLGCVHQAPRAAACGTMVRQLYQLLIDDQLAAPEAITPGIPSGRACSRHNRADLGERRTDVTQGTFRSR
ncbi:MAG: hypothetical protein AAF526_14505, partial [Pseudomonadota bacterium]